VQLQQGFFLQCAGYETEYNSTAITAAPSAFGAMRFDDDTSTQYSQYELGRVPGSHVWQYSTLRNVLRAIWLGSHGTQARNFLMLCT